ncbi:GSCOCG00011599001-RA-CDS, partial [Cotesia congregata]
SNSASVTECNKENNLNDPDKITAENLRFFQKLINIAEKANKLHENSKLPLREINKLPDEYSEPPSEEYIKIHQSHKVYLPKSTIACIVRTAQVSATKYDWKCLVKEILLEVYIKNIAQLSVKGKKGTTKPAMNCELLAAAHDWAKDISREQISDQDFNKYISKIISNKSRPPVCKLKIPEKSTETSSSTNNK